MSVVKGVTEARGKIGALISDAVREHRPAVLERNRRDHCFLVGKDDIERLVAGCEFSPEVSMGSDTTSIWLPELHLYGQGADFEAARDDLADEVRYYVEEYLANGAQYAQAPNRASHFPYVIKALAADLAGRLEDVLFAPPADAPQPG